MSINTSEEKKSSGGNRLYVEVNDADIEDPNAINKNSDWEDFSESDSDSSEPPFDFDDVDKPLKSWIEEDFPEQPDNESRGVNKVLQLFADLRSTLFKKRPISEEVEPICCDGIYGIAGLLFLLLVDIAYVAYSSYCNKLATEDDIRLIWLSALVWFVILIKLGRRLVRLGRIQQGCWSTFVPLGQAYHKFVKVLKKALMAPWNAIWANMNADKKTIKKRKSWAKISFAMAIMLGFALFCIIYYVVMVNVSNLISLSGMALLLLVSVCISRFPGKIKWHPVLVCLFIQLFFAFLTLQTEPGYEVFQFLGSRIEEFLQNSYAGSKFVFADLDCFAVNVLPVVIFFSAFMAMCFHLGIIQLLIDKPSTIASKFLKTTGPETLNAVANIFVSMTEAPLITRPYLHLCSNSELHAMIVNGFASVSGSVMAAFISFGIPANHLLIACVISAPAALAVSKIMYPETKITPMAFRTASAKIKSPYNSLLEAAMVGAMDALPICGGILANLIAFLSIYNFFNRTLIWLGYRACLQFDLTFEVIFSYILWPISFTMGVPDADALKVAELLGVKTFLNEFAAFQRLGVLIENMVLFNDRNQSMPVNYLPNGNWNITLNNGTAVELIYGALYTNKAKVIATYALCGFANIGSVGIFLGAMVSILPHRRLDLANMIIVGMIGGNIACCLTGSFADRHYVCMATLIQITMRLTACRNKLQAIRNRL